MFNCDDPSVECMHARFAIADFQAGDLASSIRIRINLSVDLTVISEYSENWDVSEVKKTLRNIRSL